MNFRSNRRVGEGVGREWADPAALAGVRRAGGLPRLTARSAIHCCSVDSLPYTRRRLPSAFVRASHRLTLSGALPERVFSAPAMVRRSSMYLGWQPTAVPGAV